MDRQADSTFIAELLKSTNSPCFLIEARFDDGTVYMTDAWKPVEKTFTVHFRKKGIRALETTTLAMLEFKFQLTQYLGDCLIADVQLVPKAK